MDRKDTTTVREAKEFCRKITNRGSNDYLTADLKELKDSSVLPKGKSITYFSYDNLTEGVIKETYSLGRTKVSDPRDLNYPISKVIKPKDKAVTKKFWEANWSGDQGGSPACVGFSWAHWLVSNKYNTLSTPPISPIIIYKEAQKLDEWPGESYPGTSVRGGVKYLRSKKEVAQYYWGYDLDSLIKAVLTTGPVVVGTNWYQNMFYPNKLGQIKVGGKLSGGHAYLIDGVDLTAKLFRIKNSWGLDWGIKGRATISFSDMSRLIKESGDICLAV